MGKKYRRPVRIKFLMDAKTSGELKETQSILDSEYKGNFDNIIDDTEPHQMTLEESFFGKDFMQSEKDEEIFTVDEVVEDAANAEELAEKRADETVYPIFYMATYKDFSEDQIDNLYHACIKNVTCPPLFCIESSILFVTSALGPSSKVRAIIGFEGSIQLISTGDSRNWLFMATY